MSNRRLAIIWTNANPIHWRIYAALEGDKLINQLTELVVKFSKTLLSGSQAISNHQTEMTVTIVFSSPAIETPLTAKHLWIAVINTLRPRQNNFHFADNNFICIFLYQNDFYFDWNFTQICSFKTNWRKSALIQIMVWQRTGNKPLTAPMMTIHALPGPPFANMV